MSDYQLFPDMGTAEYEEMKADIKARGVMIPVEYDESGNILDGHHRVKACNELGIKEWPCVIRLGMSEKDKRNHIRKINLARRHLTGEQRDKVLLDMRADGMSVRQIAEETKIPKSTVARVISSTVPNGTVELPTVITGKDGKQRQATQPERKAPAPVGMVRNSNLDSLPVVGKAESASPIPSNEVEPDQQLETLLKRLQRGQGPIRDGIRKIVKGMRRGLEKSYNDMKREFSSAVASEVAKQAQAERALIQEQRDELIELRKEAQADRDKAKAMIQGITPMMTQEEFRLVRGLLHPDRHPDEAEKYGRALTIFNRLEAGINPNIPIAVLRKSGWAK